MDKHPTEQHTKKDQLNAYLLLGGFLVLIFGLVILEVLMNEIQLSSIPPLGVLLTSVRISEIYYLNNFC